MKRKQKTIRSGCALLAALVCGQPALLQSASVMQVSTVTAAASYSGAKVESKGSKEAAATIYGGAASVVHDSSIDSDVLALNGSSFGAGWLQLPAVFSEGCDKGFSVSMKMQLAEDVANYSRIYQFATVPLGTGNTNGYNSPDISMDMNDGKSFRTSVFAGTGDSTANDEAHRSIFTLDVTKDTKWHELTAVYTPSNGAQYYLDGTALTPDNSEGAGYLKIACANLFSEKLLKNYTYNSIGHSLYNDRDIRGRFDDVAIYSYPLTAAQAASLPDDPAYLYTFEEDTITMSAEPAQDSGKAPDGTSVNSVPSLQTTSPDGTLTAKFWTDANGAYYYSVEKNGDSVILPSRLGINTTTENLTNGFPTTAPAAERQTHDEEYDMPFGKSTHIRDNYEEISFPLAKGTSVLTVIMRVYDDGIGVRYALNHGAAIKDETTQVMFPGNSTFWGNWPNNTYEYDYVELPKNRANETNATYSLPYTGEISGRYWVTVSEAGVFNEENPYCAGAVQFVGNYHSLHYKSGVNMSGINMGSAFHTPWRAVVIGDSLDQMAKSNLILNLNPPSVLEDTSWIKPGKLAWSWWSSGGDSPVEYHMQKEYIDFAAENGWDYVCVDFGWALWDNSDDKIKELCEYGAKKGIGIWLWYGVNNKGHSGYKDSKGNPAYPYYSLLDEATIKREFKKMSGYGVKGVKVDYYESDSQQTMKQMYLCATIAAKNKLMVLFHGCTIPRGESRTFPNVVSFEAINGTEYYKWFESPALANRVSYPFIRNVVGCADFTPTGLPIYGIKATAGFALADVVTIESGVQHFAHSVYTYEASKALPFLNDVPVKWDEMRVLDGRPMQFNVVARRSGNDWYIGSATLASRTVEIPLDKLITDDGVYNAYIFGDNENGSALKVDVLTGLTKDDTITRKLLDNGGFAMKLTKGTMQLGSPSSNYIIYEAENAKLNGQASITSGKDGKFASNNAYVGYVGGNGNNYITFENVEVPEAGEYTLRITYISGEPRSLKVDVNGKFVTKIDNCYANKGDWKGIRAVSTPVTLNAGKNTVKLYNDSGYGPSIDRIAIAIPNEEADYLIGDMNYDGRIDVRDLTLLKRYLMTEFPDSKSKKVGDMNGDGKLTADDAKSMVQFLTGRA